MAFEKLERTQWSGFCNLLSKGLAATGKRAEIEVASTDIGAQVEAQYVPVVGLTYDRKSDLLEVVLEEFEHLVFHPRELYVDYGPGGVENLGIVDQDNAWHIVLLRDPLMLPPPDQLPHESQ